MQAQAETLKTFFTQLKTQVHNDQGDTNNWQNGAYWNFVKEHHLSEAFTHLAQPK